MKRSQLLIISICIIALGIFVSSTRFVYAAVPSGFTQAQNPITNSVSGKIANPVASAFTPDGRMLVTDKLGTLYVIKNDVLLATPALTLSVETQGERGLLGIAVDPQFSTNNYIYLYYTTPTDPHNRVSRFTLSGDTVIPGSELVLLDLDTLRTDVFIHNGGGLHFAPDGTLFIASGDGRKAGDVQKLTSTFGKLLRINADGTIPADNPFITQTSGKYQSIYALGFRNPFSFAINNQTGRIFLNDVGQDTWEEINDIIAGKNYGWPNCEGNFQYQTTTSCNTTIYTNPLYAYPHSGGAVSGQSITGGSFYTASNFPIEYQGKYFFGDYVADWIKVYDPSSGAVSDFATQTYGEVDIQIGPDGNLYFLSYQPNSPGVYKISYQNPSSPSPSASPMVSPSASPLASPEVTPTPSPSDLPVSPAPSPSSDPSPSIEPSPTPSPSLEPSPSVEPSVSPEPTIEPSPTPDPSNTPPTVVIASPQEGATFRAGDTIHLKIQASDSEDGEIPNEQIHWQVVFHHAEHTHPFLDGMSGSEAVFTIPTAGEQSANIWYHLNVSVSDSMGTTTEAAREIFPLTSTVTIASAPIGVPLLLDDQPVPNPNTFAGVVGFVRTVEVPETYQENGVNYRFVSWSDGGARAHTFSTPEIDTTITAYFEEVPKPFDVASISLAQNIQYVSPRFQDPPIVGRTGITEAGRTVDNRLYTRSSIDGINWKEPQFFARGVGNVALTNFLIPSGGNILVSSWRGEDNFIYTRDMTRRVFPRSFPPAPDHSTIPFSSDPVLLSAAGVLYQSAIDSEGVVRWRKTTDLTQWSPWQSADFQAVGQLSMELYGNRVYMGARDATGNVFVRYSTNRGVSWTRWVDLKLVTSDERIDLQTAGNIFLMSSRMSDNRIVADRSFNGATLSPWMYGKFVTSAPLQTVTYAGVAYQFTLGEDGALYYRRSNSLGRFGFWTKTQDIETFDAAFAVLVSERRLIISARKADGEVYHRTVLLGKETI